MSLPSLKFGTHSTNFSIPDIVDMVANLQNRKIIFVFVKQDMI